MTGAERRDLYACAGRLLRLLPPEAAHALTLRVLRLGLVPAQPADDEPILAQRLWGRDFRNPVGLAAGFDKNGCAVDALFTQGFGFVEAGSVTPQPQPGNPRPRLFRLTEDGAVINRMGFNNDGIEAMARRLADRRDSGILGINLGRNKDSPDAEADYAAGARRLAPFADYLVVNVSSPNTPGLRGLQARAPLERLIAATLAARDASGSRPPLLVKIAPDLDGTALEDVAAVALAAGIDGLIVGNTTLARPPGLRSRWRDEAGGLSGRPLMALSTRVLAAVFQLTGGRLPLIGVGGIASGADAYAKIRAGASLVQLYTALVYRGPGLVTRIKRDLATRLRTDGFATLAAAVGSASNQRQDFP